jgi:Vanillate O-demethylase oxygenase C-terminal domain
MAFAEDRTIIEAQQRVIDATAAPRIMPISADRAVTMFNLMVDKMVKAESGPLRQVS